MPLFNSGPINLQQGNSASFVIGFVSSTNELTVPSSGNMIVSYINLSNVSVSETIALSASNRFFLCTWSSTSASLGLATWIVTGTSTVAQGTGQIRVLQRDSTY